MCTLYVVWTQVRLHYFDWSGDRHIKESRGIQGARHIKGSRGIQGDSITWYLPKFKHEVIHAKMTN